MTLILHINNIGSIPVKIIKNKCTRKSKVNIYEVYTSDILIYLFIEYKGSYNILINKMNKK